MRKLSNAMSGAMTALALAGLSHGAAIAADPAPKPADKPKTECFYSSEWNGWRAPDATTLYMRVNGRDIWKAEMASDCSMLRGIGVHLITRFHGTSTVCSPLDLDITVADDTSIGRETCIVKTLRKLTPQEAAAIPKKDQP